MAALAMASCAPATPLSPLSSRRLQGSSQCRHHHRGAADCGCSPRCCHLVLQAQVRSPPRPAAPPHWLQAMAGGSCLARAACLFPAPLTSSSPAGAESTGHTTPGMPRGHTGPPHLPDNKPLINTPTHVRTPGAPCPAPTSTWHHTAPAHSRTDEKSPGAAQGHAHTPHPRVKQWDSPPTPTGCPWPQPLVLGGTGLPTEQQDSASANAGQGSDVTG